MTYKTDLQTNNTNLQNILDAVNALPEAGGSENTDIEDAFVTRTLTSYENDRVTSVGKGAFYRCDSLTSIDLPNVTSIGNESFAYCDSLTSIDLPNVTSTGNQSFWSCNNLTSINLPNVTSIGDQSFEHCDNLTSINLPNCVSIGNQSFWSCNNLTSINLPNVISIGNQSFAYCDSLISIDLPNVTSIGNESFIDCDSLISINLSNNVICSLNSTSAFNRTPIQLSTDGYIYVPENLVESYKTATNWSVFANKIKPIGWVDDGSGDSGNTISFIVCGESLLTTEGITWDEFIGNGYTTPWGVNLSINSSNEIWYNDGVDDCGITLDGSTPVYGSDVIEANASYDYLF